MYGAQPMYGAAPMYGAQPAYGYGGGPVVYGGHHGRYKYKKMKFGKHRQRSRLCAPPPLLLTSSVSCRKEVQVVTTQSIQTQFAFTLSMKGLVLLALLALCVASAVYDDDDDEFVSGPASEEPSEVCGASRCVGGDSCTPSGRR